MARLPRCERGWAEPERDGGSYRGVACICRLLVETQEYGSIAIFEDVFVQFGEAIRVEEEITEKGACLQV